MADRAIYCVECDLPMGVIRDARLRKGISYLCESCNTKRIALKSKANINNAGGSQPNFDDMFGDLFGDTFGRKR